MNETAMTIAFYLMAAVTVIGGLGVVLKKNIVHNSLFMILSFVGVAGLFILLNADFLAAVQILVYAGAVAILIGFGVMLTRRPDIKESAPFNKLVLPAGIVVIGTLGIMVWLIGATDWGVMAAEGPVDSIGQIGLMLAREFVVPFEAAAMLLLMAMIGAVVVAKEVKKSK